MSAGSLACASSFSEGTAARGACFGRGHGPLRTSAESLACASSFFVETAARGACFGYFRRVRYAADAKGPPAWGGPHLFYSSGRFFHSAACFPQCMQSPVQPLQPPVRCCSMARSANAAAISTSARTTAVPGVITPPPAACRRAARRRPPPRRWRTARARRRTPTARRAHAGRTRSPRRTAYTAGRTRASSSRKAA